MARRLPAPGSLPSSDLPAREQRRQSGGPRRETTERIVVRASGFEAEGWTLNLSRGGVRVILEEPLVVGRQYALVFSPDDKPVVRAGRVVWVQDEPDGQVVGIKFLNAAGSDGPPKGS